FYKNLLSSSMKAHFMVTFYCQIKVYEYIGGVSFK
ncbi:hypothetical protein NT05LI_1872, partial [Listeria ivanovii FSL F6-596]